jgi:beta-lactam-binding protein with PASTA domain
MDIKKFFGKFVSRYLLGHLFAMAMVVLLLCIGVMYGLSEYTHHGEGIELPDLYGMDYSDAITLLSEKGIYVVANDTGYNKRMSANSVLLQMPGAGTKVKEGRTIYVTINSTSSPKVKIPDIIDNSSYREAQARLTAVGFVLLEPKVIDGERDWVYGVLSGSRNLQAGDMISIEAPLQLVIGNGTSEDEEEEDAMLDMPTSSGEDIDEFIEVE